MIVNRQIIMKAKWIWNNEAFEIVSFTNNFMRITGNPFCCALRATEFM